MKKTKIKFTKKGLLKSNIKKQYKKRKNYKSKRLTKTRNRIKTRLRNKKGGARIFGEGEGTETTFVNAATKAAGSLSAEATSLVKKYVERFRKNKELNEYKQILELIRQTVIFKIRYLYRDEGTGISDSDKLILTTEKGLLKSINEEDRDFYLEDITLLNPNISESVIKGKPKKYLFLFINKYNKHEVEGDDSPLEIIGKIESIISEDCNLFMNNINITGVKLKPLLEQDVLPKIIHGGYNGYNVVKKQKENERYIHTFPSVEYQSYDTAKSPANRESWPAFNKTMDLRWPKRHTHGWQDQQPPNERNWSDDPLNGGRPETYCFKIPFIDITSFEFTLEFLLEIENIKEIQYNTNKYKNLEHFFYDLMLKKYFYSETQITNTDDIRTNENIISIIPNDNPDKYKYRDIKNNTLYLDPGKLKNGDGTDNTLITFILNDGSQIPYDFFFNYRFLNYVKYGKGSPSGYRFLDINNYTLIDDKTESNKLQSFGRFKENVYYENVEKCITQDSMGLINEKMEKSEKIESEDIVFDTNKLHLNKIDELIIKKRVADYFNNKVKLKYKGIISINIFLEDLLHEILKEKYKLEDPGEINLLNIYDDAINQYKDKDNSIIKKTDKFKILLNNNIGQYDKNFSENPKLLGKIKQLYSGVNTWEKAIKNPEDLSILQKFEHNNLKSYGFLQTKDEKGNLLTREQKDNSKSHYMTPSFGNDIDDTKILLLEPEVLSKITIDKAEFDDNLELTYLTNLTNERTKVTEKISLPLYFKQLSSRDMSEKSDESQFYAVAPYLKETKSQEPKFYNEEFKRIIFGISHEHDI